MRYGFSVLLVLVGTTCEVNRAWDRANTARAVVRVGFEVDGVLRNEAFTL